jgi:hypothetical protein
MWTDVIPDFLWRLLEEKIFPKKPQNNNEVESTNHSGLQRDN